VEKVDRGAMSNLATKGANDSKTWGRNSAQSFLMKLKQEGGKKPTKRRGRLVLRSIIDDRVPPGLRENDGKRHEIPKLTDWLNGGKRGQLIEA